VPSLGMAALSSGAVMWTSATEGGAAGGWRRRTAGGGMWDAPGDRVPQRGPLLGNILGCFPYM
jgi:hypothetical protein